MGIDARFLKESGREVFNGNELLVKGCLEVDGGIHLATGYPGSPVAGFFDVFGAISPLVKEKGIRAFQANNEALGAAALNGSQMAPCRGIVAMKSVGVHVASDALALGNLAGSHAEGGAVLVAGDDPWCDSTQVPADSRFLCQHLRIPVVEPGTPQELKDWVDLCFKLSRAGRLYIGYIVTTAHADGGGSVLCRPNQFPEINTNHRIALDTAHIPVEKTVLLPPRTWQRELEYPQRFDLTIKAARDLGLNRIMPSTRAGEAPIGFITTGFGQPYLEHVLADLGLLEVFPILRMGMSYPVDVELVREFSKLCRHMIVIEERRSFLEMNIRDSLFKTFGVEGAQLGGRLFGKSFPTPSALGGTGDQPLPGIPELRGLNPSVLAQVLIPLIRAAEELPPQYRDGRLTAELDRIRKISKPRLEILAAAEHDIIERTPTFCPGCPHRDSSSVLLELRQNLADPVYMRRHHNRAPVDLVAHGDTGCYTMLMFAPNEPLMHNYSGMGLGGGTGSGIDPFISNKQIVFMGDGTFFHSGQSAISNSIKNDQDITYIILQNGTTAMTGHQEHPGTEVDLVGNFTWLQDIERIVRGMASTSPMTVVRLNPEDRRRYRKTLEKTILSDGVKVIIADKECGITLNRTRSKQERAVIDEMGYLPKKTYMNITPEVCEHCLVCTQQTGCPGLTTIETDYGRKIDTDLTLCVNDGACERARASNSYGTMVKPCPSFEQLTVVRHHRRRYSLPYLGLDKLPEPQPIHDMTTPGNAWRVHMSGVGGMGIGVVTTLLVRAGHLQGYRVIFQDKKGLAIRNGGVFAQITYIKEQPGDAEKHSHDPRAGADLLTYPSTGAIPYGMANLLLGIDILEAARATDPREAFRVASRDYTSTVLNLHKQPTVEALMGRRDFDPIKLRDDLFAQSRDGHNFARDISDLCEQRLGTKLYANIMMLGVAHQMGLIPVSNAVMSKAIKQVIRRDYRKNLKAYNIGRKLAVDPTALANKPEPQTWDQLVTYKTRILEKTRFRGGHLAQQFTQLAQSAVQQMPQLPEQSKYDLTLRIYDLMQYSNIGLAQRYVELVKDMYRRDSAERSYAATASAIRGIARAMLIKDEPYVAYLLTRYEKKQRDIAKYNVDLSNGDRVYYKHHTSPEFNIGKMRIRLRITTRDWHLRLVRHMKWWRKLPGWHKRETGFRDWYIGLLSRIELDTDFHYQQALKALAAPDEARGYREIRYPRQDSVRAAIEEELARREPSSRNFQMDNQREPAAV